MNGAISWAGVLHEEMCLKTCLPGIMADCRVFRVISVMCLSHFANFCLYFFLLLLLSILWILFLKENYGLTNCAEHDEKTGNGF